MTLRSLEKPAAMKVFIIFVLQVLPNESLREN